MAEAITEMIIPGTYIEVRAEGLIGVSGIATGNVGIVGTASKGPIDVPVILSSYAEAREVFGTYDAWTDGSSNELTLVRALQQVFANGGSTVYAVRTAKAGYAAAQRVLADTTGNVVTVKGKTAGTWAHEVKVQVKAAEANAFIEKREQAVTAGPLQPLHANIAPSDANVVKVTKSISGKVARLVLKTTGSAEKNKSVKVNTSTGEMTFHADDAPAAGDTIVASYQVAKSACRQVIVTFENIKETFDVADADDLKRDVAAASSLITIDITAGAGPRLPDVMDVALPLGGGSDGATAGAAEYTLSLAKLDAEPVNIVTLAGMNATSAAAILGAHVETAENNGRDRISVTGADADATATVAANADTIGDDRIILTAPGIRTTDQASGLSVTLPPAYSAAAVAGLIASLAVQVSPTNKVLRVAGLSKDYNDGELKKLIGSRVLLLEKKSGYRVVKGITTDNGAFRQISVRRIVDYAKAGTRIGSMPYIGKLNNARVRAALKATLNGFLADMVLNEALTEFVLDVTATRDQEITGVCVVTMFLKPTFSIDYVKVIMNLQ